MKIETLKFRKRKYFLYALIVGVLFLLPLVLSITFGKYQTRESIKLVEGNISYKPYDFKIMAMYQKNDSGTYKEINTIPINGYKINEEKSYCTIDNINKDSNAILKTIGNEHSIKNISPNDKCYLYFDKVVVSNIQDIINSKTISRRTDFSSTLTEDTTGTIFVAPDDYGNSFYYAGAPTDNWVKFANFYWRIIRINGDGTLRMIYSGSEESGPVTTGDATQIGTSAFNDNYNDNAYVGYMYGTPGSSTYEETHVNINDSRIKSVLETWYDNNLADYVNYFDTNAGFCGDRAMVGESGYGKKYTIYDTSNRIRNIKVPTLQCLNQNDIFTVPVGLINIDEVMYIGGILHGNNFKYYLYTSLNYWSISPSYFSDGYVAHNFYVNVGGNIEDVWTNTNMGVRPVINLKSNTQFSNGDGTASNPYIVS